jgi:hypothetical protein
MTVRTEQPERDSQNLSAGTEEPEQGQLISTRLSGQHCKDRTVRAGQPIQDSQDRTAGPGQLGQDNRERTTGTRQTGKKARRDKQNRTRIQWHVEQNCNER